MKCLVIAVGHRMPGWIAAGYEEYARRMPREMALKLTEIKPETRTDDTPGAIRRVLETEAKRIRAAVPAGSALIALDERGQQYTSQALADRMRGWRMNGKDVAFVIGGADGLDAGLKSEAVQLWALSRLTLPHGLVRVLLAEQLYRAASIVQGHPYHRA
ncbi:MAG TPA: 23S rRNA (pseudouridine(1915)-N(3))-methyltransferase RlmH [Burkholderiales bacterium]|nr:23S rRNA (pseudouridine(1915)-N(3))-methyltransferase RlmH [Burkholderiales bacterium]